MVTFSDSDWASDVSTRRSTGGHVSILAGGPISWSSRAQSLVAKSTAEAEFVAMSEATADVKWLRMLLQDLKLPQTEPTPLYEDNQAAIALARHARFGTHARTKHFDVKLHFVHDYLRAGYIDIIYCPTDKQLADAFTKPLPRPGFQTFIKGLGLKDQKG